ncbi:hypothetical protein WH47_07972, partial [Habropoda laboriosa]
INSTLDWSSLKWTNKLEQIWNLSLSQRTLILDTIGEDTIKTVLSWIVITRIVIAHVYTFTYVTNIYPIITWSRPNLLLPWLVLSFFKNVVLEVIVIAVGLLLWYDNRFSLVVFFEFVLMKVVPLIFASYNWYSNSRLFLELRHIEKLRKLRRNMRSDTNLIATRLYVKIADSKYRTRSLTTLISWESYDTYDTHDTISRIIDDPSLPPAQKTMRILGISEQDVIDARARIKEREMRLRLTEVEDAWFTKSRRDVTRYLSIIGAYDSNMREIIEMKLKTAKTEDLEDVITEAEALKNEILKDEIFKDIILKEVASTSNHTHIDSNFHPIKKLRIQISLSQNDPSLSSIKDDPISSKEEFQLLEQRSLLKKRGGTDSTDTKQTKHMKLCPSYHSDFNNSGSFLRKRDARHRCSKQTRKTVEKCCSPVKLQSFFNCNCIVDEYLHKGKQEDCFLKRTMRTSTPNGSPSKEKIERIEGNESENPIGRLCTDERKTENDDSLLVLEKFLKNDLDTRKIAEENDSVGEVPGVPDETPGVVQELKLSSNPETTLETLTMVESESVRIKVIEKDVLDRMVSVKSISGNGAFTGVNSCAQEVETNVNLPQHSFGDANIPRFYKDSMKVFDGCYEQDFANNSELQCLLKQLEKKKWSIFPGQLTPETLIPSTILKHTNQSSLLTMQDWRTSRPSVNDFEKIERYEISVSSSSKINYDHLISRIVEENEQHRPGNASDLPTNPTYLISTKDSSTQTEEEYLSRSSCSILSDTKKLKRRYKKQKHLKDPSTIASSTKMFKDNKTESRSSIWKNRHKHCKSSKPLDNQKKSSNSSKSSSDKSMCNSEIQRNEGKHTAEWKIDKKPENRRCTTKSKVNNFGTIPLSKVIQPSIFDSIVYRSKPPAYPKKSKTEDPSQTSTTSGNSKRSSAVKKLLETSKKPVDKQPTNNTKKLNWRRRTETVEEQEAREMRALKAMNEVTLLKYKKELESKRKLSSARNSVDLFPSDSSKNRSFQRRSNSDRSKRENSRNVESVYDYLGKENFSTDDRREMESIPGVSLNESKGLNTSGKLLSVSNEKYPSWRLPKVNRARDKWLENFDRLHGGQVKQDARRSKQSVEVDSRKPYTKYSKPKKQIDEENSSVVSVKKLEGAQEGRELERTPGREDFRGRLVTFDSDSNVDLRFEMMESFEDCKDVVEALDKSRENCPSTSRSGGKFEGRDDPVMTTIKPTAEHDVVSNWSSSTVYQSDEVQLAVQVAATGCPLTTDQNGTRRFDTRSQGPSPRGISLFPLSLSAVSFCESVMLPALIKAMLASERSSPTSSTRGPDAPRPTRNTPRGYAAPSPEGLPRSDGIRPSPPCRSGSSTPRNSHDLNTSSQLEPAQKIETTEEEESTNREEQLDHSLVPLQTHQTGRTPTINFTRNVEISYVANGVVLSNSSVPRSKAYNQYEIVDYETIRQLHRAFSYGLTDTVFDPFREIRPLNDILTERRLRPRDEDFLYQLSRESLGLSIDDQFSLFTEGNSSSEQTIVASIRNLQCLEETNHEEDGYLFITTIDHGGLPVTLETEASEQPNSEEELQQSSIIEIGLNEVLSSMARILRNIHGLNLENLSNIRLDIIEESVNSEDEVRREENERENEEEREENEREKEEEGSKELSRIENDILTGVGIPALVKFPDSSAEHYEELDLVINKTKGSRVNLSSIKEEENWQELEMEDETLVNSSSNSEEKTIVSLENVEDCANNLSKKGLNKTYDLLKDIEEDIEEMKEKEETEENVEIKVVEDIFKKEDVTSCQLIEESIKSIEIDENVNSTKIEELENSIELVEFENEGSEKAQMSESEENDSLDVQSSPTSSVDVEEEKKMEELTEEMSLKMVFMFWLVVIFFYVKYFYQQIFSFKQVSRSTSTLKPFEIHTVPTSTNVLLEKSELVRTVTNENLVEKEENEEEAEDLLDELIEAAEASGSSEYNSLFLDSTMYRTCSNSFKVEQEDRSKNTEQEVAGTMLYLCERVSENVRILPFLATTEDTLEEEENHSRMFRVDRHFGTPLISSIKSPIRSNRQFHNIHKVEVTGGDKRLPIVEQEEKRLLAMESAEEEIETFRFKESEDSSSSKSLLNLEDERKVIDEALDNSIYVEVDVDKGEEGRSSVEEIEYSENGKSFTITSEEEFHDESNEKEESFLGKNVGEVEEESNEKEETFSRKNVEEIKEESNEKEETLLEENIKEETFLRKNVEEIKEESNEKEETFFGKNIGEVKKESNDKEETLLEKIVEEESSEKEETFLGKNVEEESNEKEETLLEENIEEETFLRKNVEETKEESNEKEETFSEENVEEIEEVEKSNSPEIFEKTLETIDSYYSTYTRSSEASNDAAAIGDLNESSMEEFSSKGSNEGS